MKITLPSILFALLEKSSFAKNSGRNLRNLNREKEIPRAQAFNSREKEIPHAQATTTSDSTGGKKQSDVGEFPYFVDLNGCGGSLIAPNIVLTAAHCDTSGSSLVGTSALVGAYETHRDTFGAKSVTIAAQRIHHEFNDVPVVENDFMLLKLSEEVNSATRVTLSLNFDVNAPADGTDLTVLGVGLATQDEFQLSPFLRDVDVQAVNIDECNEAYTDLVIEDVMFCAGVPQGGNDACQGDSGGPIIQRNGNEHVQVGIVSWGYGCAEPGFPGVYSRVSSAHEWITQVVCDEWGESSASFCDDGLQQPPVGNGAAAADEESTDEDAPGGLQPIGGNGAPAAEARAAAPGQFTYKRSTLCSHSFCDAFFEDDSICTNSGLGSAFIYKEDGHCGIIDESGPVEVTCSVQCQL